MSLHEDVEILRRDNLEAALGIELFLQVHVPLGEPLLLAFVESHWESVAFVAIASPIGEHTKSNLGLAQRGVWNSGLSCVGCRRQVVRRLGAIRPHADSFTLF